MVSRSSRLAATFVHGDLIFLSSKVYIFTYVTNVLVHFTLFIKLALHYCTSLNTIVDATFFLVAIVICFLRNPLIRMRFNWLHILYYDGHLAFLPWSVSLIFDTFCCMWRSWVNVNGTNTCLWTHICVSFVKFLLWQFFSNKVDAEFWSRYPSTNVDLNNENMLILL